MSQKGFDDTRVREAMRAYLEAVRALDDAASTGGEARDLLDLAETKTVAGLALRKRLEEVGWTAPGRTPAPTR